MTTENVSIAEGDRIRIAIIRLAYDNGLRADNIGPGSDLAPWLIGGLRAMENDQELNPDLLREFDAAQTMVSPETASPVKKG